MRNYIDDTPYLAHHGVKGMKWGVRHDRKRSSNSKGKMKRSKKRKKKNRVLNDTEVLIYAGSMFAGGYAGYTAASILSDDYAVQLAGEFLGIGLGEKVGNWITD